MAPNSSLLQWLATFKLDNKTSVELRDDAYYNLADGFVCARILNQITPQYFSDKWLDGIKPVPPNGSWRLRVSNLKRILQKIHDYASDLQSSQFRPNAIVPDVAVIAQNFDPDQISRLIQLILFCAINCDKKEDYIETIRLLPTQVKQDIKEAIEELLIKNNDNYSQKLNTSQTANESCDLNTSTDSRADTSSSTILSPTRSNFRSPLRRNSTTDTSRNSNLDSSSHSNHDNLETLEDIRQSLKMARTINDLKSQACHELELKLKQLQLEKEQLAYENEKLSKEKNLSSPRRLSDTIKHPHRDLDNTFDTRILENRIRNLDDDKSQDLIMQQNKKLHSELNRLKEDIIKLETEKEDYRLKCELLKEDLDRVTSRHDDLRVKAELAKRLQDELDEHKQVSEKAANYETMLENLVRKNNEIKREFKSLEEKNVAQLHKIVQLEEENGRLTSSIGTGEVYKKQLHELRVKLSQETYRADKAEVDLTKLSERFASIKKENEKLYETTNQLMRNGSNTTVKDIPETSNAVDLNHSNSDSTLVLINRVEELQRQLFQREQELLEAETKYKKHLHKAKEVIKTLNNNQSLTNSQHPSCMSSTSSFNCSSIDEVNLLKQQLKEREDRLIELEREYYEFKKFKEVHERLIISAFYGMTTPMQWRNADKRLEKVSLTSPPNTASSSINNLKHSH